MKRYEITLLTGELEITQEVFAVNEEAAKTKMLKRLGYYGTDVPYQFTKVEECSCPA